jgi:hypothetical protein
MRANTPDITLRDCWTRNGAKTWGCIEEDVPESNYQGLQQFVSDSPWEHAPLMEQLAGEAARLTEAPLQRRTHKGENSVFSWRRLN